MRHGLWSREAATAATVASSPGAAERRGVAALARVLRVRMAGANGADHCAFIEATVTVLINSGAITSSSRNVSVPDSAR
jgi:hypothetical protein